MKLVKKTKASTKAKTSNKTRGRGRPTFFRGKFSNKPLKSGKAPKNVPPPTTILYSKQGLNVLDEAVKRLTKEYRVASKNPKARVSRNVVSEALTRIYGPTLTLKQIQRADSAAA